METLAQRLKFVMDEQGISQNALARMIGVTQPSIKKVLNGDTLNPKYILEIADALNVSPEWLKTGKGDTPDFSKEVEDEEENGHLVRVEVLDVYASAGNGEFLTGDLAGDIQAVEFASEYFYNLFQRASEKGMAIVNVKGDSMEPTLSSGDLLFVDTTRTYYQGDGLYVFSFGDSLYVKRLQRAGYKLLVLSDNKFYDTWDVNESNEDQFFIHGKVEFLQGKIRRVG
ncbi:helix-turn-helix transcriptional regulator [Haemophilus parahaemolyticus]|uniref:XRE family transcriptional regulator n=1 Tax=Haemophilus parahaemolyticus TaxID=735 RepID=UPI000DAB4D09|nr:helix-turn-helix transcriptional regulator [Haemophilus parahaemolyticus]RDE82776.1 helix-turn-helix transcriptional regulator [Haemophilus parahaemolyticus]